MSRTLLALSLLALTACRFLGSRDAPGVAFDFGPATALASRPAEWTAPANLIVANIVAPGWMDNPSMYYRLLYRNASNPLPYAHSQWVASPAALLTQHLRWSLVAGQEGDRASGGPTENAYVLRGELTEFDQIFDRPGHSRGVLRLRATLERPRSGWSQRTFEIERPAPTPDAVGGVSALGLCADALSEAVTRWVTDELGDGAGTIVQ
jgi:cholesterol transport system auxiliary component